MKFIIIFLLYNTVPHMSQEYHRTTGIPHADTTSKDTQADHQKRIWHSTTHITARIPQDHMNTTHRSIPQPQIPQADYHIQIWHSTTHVSGILHDHRNTTSRYHKRITTYKYDSTTRHRNTTGPHEYHTQIPQPWIPQADYHIQIWHSTTHVTGIPQDHMNTTHRYHSHGYHRRITTYKYDTVPHISQEYHRTTGIPHADTTATDTTGGLPHTNMTQYHTCLIFVW